MHCDANRLDPMAIALETLRCYDGPNVWFGAPVTHLRIDLGSLALEGPNDFHVLAAWLTDVLRDVVAPAFEAVRLEPIAFKTDRGSAVLVGTLVLNLQRLAGFPVGFCAAGPAGAERSQEVVVEHADETVGAAASRLAAHVLDRSAAGNESATEVSQSEVVRFATVTASRRLGFGALPILASARRRGIPVSRVDPSGRIIELGNGAFRRRIYGSATSLTSAIAESICENKHLTNHYLRSAGLPVPDGTMARTIEQALAAAHEIGYPVAVKPVDAGAAIAVFLDVRDDDELRTAFAPAVAASPSGRALVERIIAGNEYRAVVINHRVVAVGERIPAHVVGDGEHTINELIDIANADPRRGRREIDPLRPIVVDGMAMDLLDRQELELDSIPIAGRRVKLKPHGEFRRIYQIDRTDVVHPDNAAIILQAVRVLDLDVASVDLVAPDIAESIWTTGGAVIELNSRSGFLAELYPGEGLPRDPGCAVVEMLFPPGRPVRAPIVAVTGDPRTSAIISQLVAQTLAATGAQVGLVSRAGLVIAGRRIRAVDALDPAGVQTLLNNPATEIAVAEVDAREIVDHGLGFDYCETAVVTSLSGLSTPFGQPVETVLTALVGTDGVLVVDADDGRVAPLAQDRESLPVLFALSPDNGLIRDHVARGGKAVVVRSTPSGDTISLITGDGETEVLNPTSLPSAADLSQSLLTRARVAAIAAAVAQVVPIATIRRALS
jgi:cyanophycin synthetase